MAGIPGIPLDDLAAAPGPSPDGTVHHTRTATRPGPDPLVMSVAPVEASSLGVDLAAAVHRAQALPVGGHLLAASNAGGDRRVFALVRVPGPAQTSVVVRSRT